MHLLTVFIYVSTKYICFLVVRIYLDVKIGNILCFERCVQTITRVRDRAEYKEVEHGRAYSFLYSSCKVVIKLDEKAINLQAL